MTEISRILYAIEQGDPQAADQLLPLVYDELRKLAAARLAQESPGQTLQPTELVHEAYVRLVDRATDQRWSGRGHFFAAAAEAMRRILIELARQKATAKRGGQRNRVPLEDVETANATDLDDLLPLDDALQRLFQLDPQAAEVVKLRYFAGLTMEEVAAALGISIRTAYYTWENARTWLHRELRQID